MKGTDWTAWHDHYDDPGSRASRRLRVLQERLRVVLDRRPPGPIRVVVPCAGQGRDLLGVLVDHPRRDDVTAALVETDGGNASIAMASAQRLDVSGITVVRADAGCSDAYVDVAPASVVVLSGFFDYLSERDLDRLIAWLPQLCASGASVLWARRVVAGVHPPASIRARFEGAGFRPTTTGLADDDVVHVGVERFDGPPLPLEPGRRVFTFHDPAPLPITTATRVRRHLAWRMRSAMRGMRRHRG